jgi:phage shock protein A
MNNPFVPCATTRRIALAATLLACGTVEMFAQPAPANQDVQALVAEIKELKSRLSAVEAKLDAYRASALAPPVTPAVESQLSTTWTKRLESVRRRTSSRQARAIRFRRLHLDERPESAKIAASLQLLCNS